MNNVLTQESSCPPWEQGTGTAPWQWETERPLRLSLQLPAKSGLFPAELMPCSIPQILPSKWTYVAYYIVPREVHPAVQVTCFSSLHSLPTESFYSLQGIPSLPWCLCFVNIYRLLSYPSCSARLYVLCSFNLLFVTQSLPPPHHFLLFYSQLPPVPVAHFALGKCCIYVNIIWWVVLSALLVHVSNLDI